MIVAGFGFTGAASIDSLDQALRATGFTGTPTKLATPADKGNAPAWQDFVTAKQLPVCNVIPDALQAQHTVTQSRISRQNRNTGSVAEAAALAAAGPGATLLVTRQISNDRMATCAIAEGPDT